MKIKIVHIINSLFTGGAEQFLNQLIQNSLNSDSSHSIITLIDGGDITTQLKQKEYNITSTGLNNVLSLPKAIKKLAATLNKEQPDIIQTWLYHSDFIGGLTGKLITKKPVIWNVRHANLEFQNNKIATLLIVKILSYLSKNVPHTILANSSSAVKSHISWGYNKNKFHIIPNGINTSRFTYNAQQRIHLRNSFKIQQNDFLIGMIARFNPQKDFHNFLKSASNISKKYQHVKFLLCGREVNNENKFLTDLILKYNLSNKCILLGYRTDIPYLLSCLDLYVSSSAGESFPNSVAEAMACSIPCVVTDVGSSAEIVGNAGLSVPAKNPTLLAQASGQFIQMSAEERHHYAKLARQRICMFYSMTSAINSYNKFYKHIFNTSHL